MRVSGIVVAVASLLVWSSAVAQTQIDFSSSSRFGGGFTTNIPHQWLGFCLFGTRPGNVGLYFDLKTSIPMVYGGDDLYDNISVSEAEGWGDALQQEKDTWLSMNVGVTFPLASRVALYAGAGYSANPRFRNYYDEFHILGTHGSYWVKAGDTDYVNGIAGLFMILGSSWGVQVGGELHPSGMTCGVFWLH